jgi:arginine deiminase
MEPQYGIGPHGERMNVLSRRVTSQEMMERIRNREDNVLSTLIEKFKRQMHNFDGTKVYPDEVLNVKLEGLDKLLSHNGRLAPLLSSL